MLNAFRNDDACQPSLLDRLRDDRPKERNESLAVMNYSWTEYRDSVVRDLQWLLNTTGPSTLADWSRWEEVEKSTLNFGVPEVCATSVAAVAQRRWEVSFQQALARFEPRLREETIRVRLLTAELVATKNLVVMEISAELVVAPLPIRFRVTIDRETSTATIHDSTTRKAA
jgi:type VI secretion system protein ImpF